MHEKHALCAGVREVGTTGAASFEKASHALTPLPLALGLAREVYGYLPSRVQQTLAFRFCFFSISLVHTHLTTCRVCSASPRTRGRRRPVARVAVGR